MAASPQEQACRQDAQPEDARSDSHERESRAAGHRQRWRSRRRRRPGDHPAGHDPLARPDGDDVLAVSHYGQCHLHSVEEHRASRRGPAGRIRFQIGQGREASARHGAGAGVHGGAGVRARRQTLDVKRYMGSITNGDQSCRTTDPGPAHRVELNSDSIGKVSSSTPHCACAQNQMEPYSNHGE
jgi:hypothetical protein